MKNILMLSLLGNPWSEGLSACSRCRAQVVAGTLGSPDFGIHGFLIVLPILILGTLGLGFYYADPLLIKLKELTRWRK